MDPIVWQTPSFTVPAGETVPVVAQEYFAIYSGAGLKMAPRGREGSYGELPERVLIGDGNGRLGTLMIHNPTGAPVAVVAMTSSKKFDPSTAGSVQDVVITGFSASPSVVGAAAHDAAVSGAPVLQGAEARTALGAAVAQGDAVRVAADPHGRQITIPHAPRAAWLHTGDSGVAAGAAGQVTALPAAAGLRTTLVEGVIYNHSAATDTAWTIRDGAGGAVLARGFVAAKGSCAVPRIVGATVNTALVLEQVAAASLSIVASGHGEP